MYRSQKIWRSRSSPPAATPMARCFTSKTWSSCAREDRKSYHGLVSGSNFSSAHDKRQVVRRGAGRAVEHKNLACLLEGVRMVVHLREQRADDQFGFAVAVQIA